MNTNGESTIRISQVTDNPTIAYAAEELKRCLSSMSVQSVDIRLGLIADLSDVKSPSVADSTLDDAIEVDVKNGIGYVAGINPRSVLLAVYRYLGELGCRWSRPGADGEYFPTLLKAKDVKLSETPSYRHRGICIEGAVSHEDIRDTIEWMPKVGFNAFFTQFRLSYTFFERWYSHELNPFMKPEEFSPKKAEEIIADVVNEIEKRDILYHAVGHGWTCEPFGISCLGWEKPEDEQEPTDEVRQYLAEINGERKFWRGGPINTNLCYGNPEVRRIITEDIANYAETHPEIDILHFWLADGWNNHCECELCRNTRPADFFVDMLNDVDRLFTERNISTRIVLLIYVDLLWPPVERKILNPDRFMLMFAPITRTYSTTFAVTGELPAISAYERNKLVMPESVEENISFLKAWQDVFAGDSFDFDYHIMWDHYYDPGYYQISKTLYEDIKGLKDVGLNGYVSCQTQRSYFPTGLPMVVMGRALWDSSLDFDRITEDYMSGAFGPDGELAREYLAKLSELFDPVYLRGEKPSVNTEAAEKYRQIPGVINAFLPVIERNLNAPNECWKRSWFYMKKHAEIFIPMAAALEAKAVGDRALCNARWEEIKTLVCKMEPEVHSVLDVWLFVGEYVFDYKFGLTENAINGPLAF